MLITHLTARAGAVVIATALASGCGGTAPARIAPVKAAATTTRPATAPSPALRGRHLREYRQMIVALYRVPGAEALNARYPDPLDQLGISLRRTYGGAAPRIGQHADLTAASGQ
jgi:hypothetical protein